MEMERYQGETFVTPNDTNCTWPPADTLQVKSATKKTLVVVFLGVLTLLTALANGGVIAAICTTRKLRLPANFLICSLAITDFLVAALVMPLSTLYIAAETWALGHMVCEAWLSVDMTFCTCSILHLCAIALDRYWAITNAVEYARKRTAGRAAAMVAGVWAISIAISLPPHFWRRGRGEGGGARPRQCTIQHDHMGYTVYSTLGAFYIPLVLILVLYYRIYSAAKMLYQKRGSMRYLSSQNSLGADGNCRAAPACVSDLSTSDPTQEFDRLHLAAHLPPLEAEVVTATQGCGERSQICSPRERKAARILGLILGAFVFCWLPFFIKEVLVGLGVASPSPQVSDILTWLGYVNSLVNPLLYTSFNEDFKQAFKRLLTCKEHP